MIIEEGKYYLYRHIRLDKNEPFYIGIGTKKNNKWKSSYERSYSKKGRNKIWNDIVNKNENKYKVEILFESDSYDFIKEKEKEFIKLYGQKTKNGLLANLSLGGEGAFGVKHTKEIREKARLRALNMSQDTKDKISKTISKIQLIPIYQYSFNGDFIKEWLGLKIAGQKLKISRSNITMSAKDLNSNKGAGGFLWRYYKTEKIKEKTNINWRNSILRQYDSKNNLLSTFDSVANCAKILKIDVKKLYESIRSKNLFLNSYWVTEKTS